MIHPVIKIQHMSYYDPIPSVSMAGTFRSAPSNIKKYHDTLMITVHKGPALGKSKVRPFLTLTFPSSYKNHVLRSLEDIDLLITDAFYYSKPHNFHLPN